MRLIDADTLKEWVENWLYKDRYYHNGRVGKTIPITELYDILEQIPIADVATAQQWIPVSERLPESCQRAICQNRHGEMMIGTYTAFGWMFPCYFEKPIAWMPLPEPYKEE